MKKGSQRPEGCNLGLKSKTFILSFLSQIIPHRQTTASMFVVQRPVFTLHMVHDTGPGVSSLHNKTILCILLLNTVVYQSSDIYIAGHLKITPDSESIDSLYQY